MRLHMISSSRLVFAIVAVGLAYANGQDASSPTTSPAATQSPVASPSVTPTPSPATAPIPSITASPLATVSPSATRSVKISFLPPPMEGTISLGIYDGTGKLVRVLVQEGNVDEFEVGADA